ncbi:glycosyltransferase family 4 protein [Tenacibaculum sp. SG-28]|uniref:glycosyltransferase family 4 protein n=1 Tax=Tenacibaculum sp. SG-28 TaxID=754426 RepID=UPI000CF43502|nr:glycosyltransferase family 4 protein [Tenacibaculum sp. SG-28]PQJ21095.1 hypothetical protein BSU00_08770 [Tenacibaculum sp. SG-28]
MKKAKIALELSTTGKGGGPYTSTSRIMNSDLKKKYDFHTIHYKTELGSGISLKRIKDLIEQIKRINPDIVHYSGLQLSGFHMAVACKFAGVKNTVMTVRGFSGDAIYFNIIKKSILTYILEPITILLSKKVIAVSNYVLNRRVLRFFGTKDKRTIYNFPPKLPKEKQTKKSLREELGIEKDDIVIVTVARIIKDKGYQFFDEAILNFNKKANLKFVIVGDGLYLGNMKKKLEKMVNNKQVFFLGYRGDINHILKACDIFVLPTLHETLSVALLEASQASLALIASRTGGVPEIVENNYNGILTEPSNVGDLTNAISYLIENEELIGVYGARAKEKVNEKFSNASIEKGLDEVYSSLLKGNG